MPSSKIPSLERINELFLYNKDTGVFVWKKSPRIGVKKGSIAGSYTDSGYVMLGFDGVRLRAHKIAWAIVYGEWIYNDIDHINGIKDDNRIVNLRVATRSQNCQNSVLRTDNKTGQKGVHFRKDTGKYSAYIQVDNVVKWLGCFDKIEDAIQKRVDAEKELHPFRRIA